MFGPWGFWTMAPLRCTAKFDPFLSLDCALMHSTLAQSKERKGSNLICHLATLTGDHALNVFLASGPYTPSDNLDYVPLSDLLAAGLICS